MKYYRHLEAENFDGSLNIEKAVEWLKKIEKIFTSIEISDREKVSTVKMFLQGVVDSWMDRIHRLYGDQMIW